MNVFKIYSRMLEIVEAGTKKTLFLRGLVIFMMRLIFTNAEF